MNEKDVQTLQERLQDIFGQDITVEQAKQVAV